jgi:hypothetical protein
MVLPGRGGVVNGVIMTRDGLPSLKTAESPPPITYVGGSDAADTATGTDNDAAVASCSPATRLRNRDLRKRIVAFVEPSSQIIEEYVGITA